MEFAEIDGNAVPAELAVAVNMVKHQTGAYLSSCYRGQDPKAQAILRKNGKKNQQQLWNESQQPGSNIRANPPGYSTHECRNDGVAYRLPRGAKLKPWQCGMDWQINKVPSVVAAFNAMNFEAVVTYPNSSYERQHVNLMKFKPFKVFKNLKLGSKSPRVRSVRKNLAFVLDPTSLHPYLISAKRKTGSQFYFDRELEFAVREFQEDHGLKADGIYGYRTAQQLAASVRFRKQKNKGK